LRCVALRWIGLGWVGFYIAVCLWFVSFRFVSFLALKRETGRLAGSAAPAVVGWSPSFFSDCSSDGVSSFPSTALFWSWSAFVSVAAVFFGSDVGDGRVQWYAFFALPPGSKKAPSGWGGSTREDQSDPQAEEVVFDLLKADE